MMQAIGFAAISAVPEHIRFEQDLRVWLDMVRRRDLNSQLLAISDRAYEEGIARLERQLAYGGATTFACSPFGGISSTQYRLIGMACSRRNLVSGERMAATQRRVFAADLLLMQQTQIIDSNWGCSSGATRIVGDFRTDAGSHRGPIKLV
jgi:hypothetical protein